MAEHVYRIHWTRAGPNIKIGEIVVTGAKGKGRRVREKGVDKLQSLGGWHDTVQKALDNEVRVMARRCDGVISVGKGTCPPYGIEYLMSLLRRLRLKCSKHGISTFKR